MYYNDTKYCYALMFGCVVGGKSLAPLATAFFFDCLKMSSANNVTSARSWNHFC